MKVTSILSSDLKLRLSEFNAGLHKSVQPAKPQMRKQTEEKIRDGWVGKNKRKLQRPQDHKVIFLPREAMPSYSPLITSKEEWPALLAEVLPCKVKLLSGAGVLQKGATLNG